MEDQSQVQHQQDPSSKILCQEKSDSVRSRWSPKPEQILILESIFNSGMVNPPKEETVRIRKMLEKFGKVGDANVFYWFQNRRSRSRRRQRQIQAGLVGGCGSSCGGARGGLEYHQLQQQPSSAAVGLRGAGAIDEYHNNDSHAAAATIGFSLQQPCLFPTSSSSSSSSSCSHGAEEFFPVLAQAAAGFPETEKNPCETSTFFQALDCQNFHYDSGFITVFINGVPAEVQRGPLNIKATFGHDLVLIHSSGVLVPVDDYGFSVLGLEHGESYFLVSRSI